MAERRPFHETVVGQIRDETPDAYDLNHLGRLIMATKIPKNHDAIIAAWKERTKETDDEDDFLASVLADLQDQKREAEAEARAKEEKALTERTLRPENLERLAERLEMLHEPFDPDKA